MSEEEIKKKYPLSSLDELTEDEILYWSTPYGKELEKLRKMKKEDHGNKN
jgi:hypothetical protein